MNLDPAGFKLDSLTISELEGLITEQFARPSPDLFAAADAVRRANFGGAVFVRGLIEFTNYCKNDCYYCGIRRSNLNASRYRLGVEDILRCCKLGHELGFRSFVLQGGEDAHFTDDRVVEIVSAIRARFADSAITLSVGEKSRASYQRYFAAGANRYLLRHETADAGHYSRLHPENLNLERRKECLWNLKNLGYQTGAGFMVGSPGQTARTLAEDLVFLRELQPQMVGIGPFIPQHDTPFAGESGGGLKETMVMLALTRLLLPRSLLPSTTALGSIHPQGREMGLKAGANVVMPNLSPPENRARYALYDNKAAFGAESAEGVQQLVELTAAAGYRIDFGRGDYAG